MVAPVSSNDIPTPTVDTSSGTSAAGGSLVSGADASLGKDAFLKLLVAQMSHQDPLNPMDDTAFVSQLAQFSSLEQTMGINTHLDTISSQMQGMGNTEVSSLVGKNVTVKGNTVAFDGSFGAQASFTLAGAANTVDVSFVDASGNTVRTMHLGPHAPGLATISWDGNNDAGVMQPAGVYSVQVKAADSAGAPIDVSQETSGKLQAINFEKGYPSLQLDNGVVAPASDLLQVNSTNP